jgi:hypothetical protein
MIGPHIESLRKSARPPFKAFPIEIIIYQAARWSAAKQVPAL